MLIKICVRNLKFPIYIPQIKGFDIVIFSVATDFNVLYDVRGSLEILMAVCYVHIFFEIRVFKNINFVSRVYDCDIRHVFVTQRVTDRKLYFLAIYGSISSNGMFRILSLTRFQFHLKRIYCLTIVICTICYYFSKLKNTLSYKTAPPPYAYGLGLLEFWLGSLRSMLWFNFILH